MSDGPIPRFTDPAKVPRMTAAQCPFYIRNEAGHTIVCEGWTPGSTTKTAFSRIHVYDRHRRDRCGNMPGYESCPVYQMIMATKYADTEGAG